MEHDDEVEECPDNCADKVGLNEYYRCSFCDAEYFPDDEPELTIEQQLLLYEITIFRNDEEGGDQGYIALVPDLRGCSAFGATREEALAEIYDAMEAWVRAAQQVGNPIPEPTLQGQQLGFSLKRIAQLEDIQGRQAEEISTLGIILQRIRDDPDLDLEGCRAAAEGILGPPNITARSLGKD